MRMPIPNARTVACEMTGTSALDWQEGSELEHLAAACGIDVSRWFPVAFEMFGIHLGALVFYCVDRNVAGKTAAEIADFADDHNAALVVHKLEARTCPLDWDAFIRRFHVVLKSELIKDRDVTVAPRAEGAA